MTLAGGREAEEGGEGGADARMLLDGAAGSFVIPAGAGAAGRGRAGAVSETDVASGVITGLGKPALIVGGAASLGLRSF